MNDPTPPSPPTPPPPAEADSAWRPVRPIQRPGGPPGGFTRTQASDPVAEAQVRGLGLAFYGLALLQLVLAALVGALSRGVEAAEDPGLQAPLLLPFVFLGVGVAIKLVESRQSRLLAAVVLAFPMLLVFWNDASSGVRATLNLAANAAVFAGLGSGLWEFKPSARALASGWALYLLALPWILLPGDLGPLNLYLGALAVIVLVTLYLPRTGKVFDDRYLPTSQGDPRVNPLQSLALWGVVAWVAYPLVRLVGVLVA